MERVTFAASGAMEGNTLTGIAHAFGQRAVMDGRYIEFARGAFDEVMARAHDVRAFMGHDTNLLLGREASGTVRVVVEPEGLRYAIDLPSTSYADDLKALVTRGDITEMSFGIVPGKYKTGRAEDGKPIFIHTSVKELFDISPVSMPAFSGTSVELHRSDHSELRESPRSQAVRARHRANKGVN